MRMRVSMPSELCSCALTLTAPPCVSQGRPVNVPMLAKAAAASVLQWLTLPRNYDLQEYQLLLGSQTQAALPFTLGGLEARVAAAAKGSKPSAEDAALLQAAEDGGLVPPAGPPGGAPTCVRSLSHLGHSRVGGFSLLPGALVPDGALSVSGTNVQSSASSQMSPHAVGSSLCRRRSSYVVRRRRRCRWFRSTSLRSLPAVRAGARDFGLTGSARVISGGIAARRCRRCRSGRRRCRWGCSASRRCRCS